MQCYQSSQIIKIPKNKELNFRKNSKPFPTQNLFFFPAPFFANAHQHICKIPTLNQQPILQKS